MSAKLGVRVTGRSVSAHVRHYGNLSVDGTTPDMSDTSMTTPQKIASLTNIVSIALRTFHYRLEAERVVGSYLGVGFGAGARFIVTEGGQSTSVWIESLPDICLVCYGKAPEVDLEGRCARRPRRVC